MRALESIQHYLTGYNEFVIVDDSGNAEWVEYYRSLMIDIPNVGKRQPLVLAKPSLGYNVAMQTVTRVAAGHRRFLFWEEDFTATKPTDLFEMSDILRMRPYLAQLALQRQPWFDVEKQVGSMLDALIRRKPDANFQTTDRGVIEHNATFTCNPAVWNVGIAERGWPVGEWSEDQQTRALLADHYSFGFMPEVRVFHDGSRSGHGY